MITPLAAETRHSGGFTLVELLIAFSLVALVSLLLFSGLRLGLRSWESVDGTAEQNAELRVARNFLERVLSQARAVTLSLDGEPVLVFSGDARNLEFAAPLSENVGTPGLNILRLGLEGREAGRLVLTRWLLHPDVLAGTPEIPEWEPFDGRSPSSERGAEDRDVADGAYGTVLLAETVAQFEIAYFGPLDDDLGGVPAGEIEGEWQSEWLERRNPPQAVRIRLTTAQRDWPDMVVRLASQPDTGFRARRRGTQTSAGP